MEKKQQQVVSSMNPIHVDKTEGLYTYTRDRQIHQSNTAIVRGPAKNKLKKNGMVHC